MWIAYIVLIVIAGVSFGFGILPIGLASVIILIGLVSFAVLGTAGRTRNKRVPRGGPGDGVPSTGEASYQPGADPTRSGS